MERRNRDLAAGLALALLAYGGAASGGLSEAAAATAGVTALCAAWWILEPIPLAATSLVPFVLFPLAGVLDHQTVARSYGHTLILLLLGGFMLSRGVEKSGLHRRLALFMVRAAGRTPKRLLAGFMLASAVCSMWISNTATVLMLLPVALAVIGDEQQANGDDGLATPLLLGIAYAASIGGLATPIGTPPNVIFMGVYEATTQETISFLDWMAIGVPATLICLPLAWWWLARSLGNTGARSLPTIGPWRAPARRMAILFALTALAWMFRTAPFGGWSEALSLGGVSDSTVALAAVLLLFIIPDGDGGELLDWETARTIPWGLLILFGGGIAISEGFEASGLSKAIGTGLHDIATLSTVMVTLALCLVVTFLTEVTSNTATANLLLPILAATALGAGIDPRVLMIPATLSASCAFMLPVATAPNAIVCGTPYVSTQQMVRAGLVLNLACAIAITVVCVALI